MRLIPRPKTISFPEPYDDFTPNLTPRQIFQSGAFGGTYFRKIYSSVNNKYYENVHKNYTSLKDIPDNILTIPFDKYNKSLNKYKVKVGSTLEFWEDKNWIRPSHPYGWIQWYIEFYERKGKKNKQMQDEDRIQINRWKSLAGPNGRFRKQLINRIRKQNTKFDNDSISPKIRQTLLHWGYELTENDFKNALTKS